jgi:hypothetical protein
MFAELVLRRICVEAIGCERPFVLHQLEMLGRDSVVQYPLFRADRAIAGGDLSQVGFDPEPHSTAMAPALKDRHKPLPSQSQIKIGTSRWTELRSASAGANRSPLRL